MKAELHPFKSFNVETDKISTTRRFLCAINWTIISTGKILNVWDQFRPLLEWKCEIMSTCPKKWRTKDRNTKRIFPWPSVLRAAFRACQCRVNPSESRGLTDSGCSTTGMRKRLKLFKNRQNPTTCTFSECKGDGSSVSGVPWVLTDQAEFTVGENSTGSVREDTNTPLITWGWTQCEEKTYF